MLGSISARGILVFVGALALGGLGCGDDDDQAPGGAGQAGSAGKAGGSGAGGRAGAGAGGAGAGGTSGGAGTGGASGGAGTGGASGGGGTGGASGGAGTGGASGGGGTGGASGGAGTGGASGGGGTGGAGAGVFRLDESFGKGGVVTFDALAFDPYTPHQAEALLPLEDGSVLVAAGDQLSVIKLRADGSLDPSFGQGGWLRALGESSWGAETLSFLRQSDGKILVGNTLGSFGVMRLNPDGSLDPSFGQGGLTGDLMSVTGGNDPGGVYGLAVQPDGAILAAGHGAKLTSGGLDHEAAVLVRLRADGTLDETFGQGGAVMSSFFSEAYGLSLDSSGAITVGGFGSPAVGPAPGCFLQRYSSAGVLDPTFGDGGTVNSAVAPSPDDGFEMSICRAFARRDDGGFVQGAYVLSNQANAGILGLFFAARRADGSLDPGLDLDGEMLLDSAGRFERVNQVAALADGSIFAVGLRADETAYDTLALHLLPDGSPDASFGAQGAFTLDLGTYERAISVVEERPGGAVLVGGSFNTLEGYPRPFVARFVRR